MVKYRAQRKEWRVTGQRTCADSSLATLGLSLLLKLFVFVVVVQTVFFDNIQFDGIESDNFEFSPTLFA